MSRGKDEAATPVEVPTGEASGIEKFTVAESKDEGARKLNIEFNFGGSTARAVEIFGEEAVYNGFVKGAKVALQSNIRGKLSQNGNDALTDDEILGAIADWKPGTRTTRAASKTSKLEKLMEGMTDEDRQAMIEKLQNMGTEAAA